MDGTILSPIPRQVNAKPVGCNQAALVSKLAVLAPVRILPLHHRTVDSRPVRAGVAQPVLQPGNLGLLKLPAEQGQRPFFYWATEGFEMASRLWMGTGLPLVR